MSSKIVHRGVRKKVVANFFFSYLEQSRSACCASGELSASYVMVIIAAQLR